MITLWHNPRCSKSRQTLKLLEERGAQVSVRKYLEESPTRHELERVSQLLGLPAAAMIRSSEKLYKELELDKADSSDVLFDAMAENPILIERPIAIHADRAAIGRPPENVLPLLG